MTTIQTRSEKWRTVRLRLVTCLHLDTFHGIVGIVGIVSIVSIACRSSVQENAESR